MSVSDPINPAHGNIGRPRTRWILMIGLAAVAAALGIAAYLKTVNIRAESNAVPDELLRSARESFDRGDFPDALQRAEDVLEKRPQETQAAIIGAKSAMNLRQFSVAVRFLDRVPKSELTEYVAAQSLAGDLLLRMKRLSAAETRYRRVLQADAGHVDAADRLAFLCGLSSRYWEQIPFRLRMIQYGRYSGAHLMSLALADEALENPELIAEFHRADPGDPAPYVTLARMAEEDQDYAKARKLLETAVNLVPQLAAAQLHLGRLLFAHGSRDDFLRWHAALPRSADDHPGIWILRGDWTAKHSEPRAAVRCYAEALQRDPNHSHSNYQLGRLLTQLKQPEKAAPFFQRARLLRRFVNIVKVAHVGDDPPKMKEAVEVAEQLGLFWEAYAWAGFLKAHTKRSDRSHAWAEAVAGRLKSKLPSSPSSRCVSAANPVRGFPLHEFRMPQFPKPSGNGGTKSPGGGESVAVRFIDQAESAGLRFRYFNGSESVANGMKKMYEFAGGGVAILDYDGDGLPDVYLAQGCRWPPTPGQSQFLDRLYRNAGDGRFVDATQQAGLHEDGFSQGVSVGDFDSDGWPDLVIGNIGANRLYRNNGDGTFTDVTASTGIAGNRWTTSCLLADVNGDGHPDLYAVNYLAGDDVFTRVCRNAQGDGICLPQNFQAAQDQLYTNLGDGRFREVTDSAGIRVPDGKGLGIVAADLDGSGRLSLFVANDTTPNFLFVNRSERRPEKSQFSELAIVRGLALNREGRTESCMGVAVGDADGDGKLDLFVTNFYAESNTLYRQISPGVFEDVTPLSGLGLPSLPMVGFGTQFIDADLDGRLDLIITNGHIDDLRKSGVPMYQMPPQFFVNRRKGRFEPAPAKLLGPYFQKNYLGRALARLDWNQDGREDVVITHLDVPTALLTNTTPNAGHFLSLQLRGVESNRDAIGTVVTAEVAGRRLVRQLTAGDGYLCSNERQLTFGLGPSQRIDRLIIRWPSGRREIFADVRADSRILVVEGRGRPLPLPSAFGP